jgi:hypothetical protein
VKKDVRKVVSYMNSKRIKEAYLHMIKSANRKGIDLSYVSDLPVDIRPTNDDLIVIYSTYSRIKDEFFNKTKGDL